MTATLIPADPGGVYPNDRPVHVPACSVHGHEPIEILNAGISPQVGMCARCSRRLNPAYTIGAAELAAALELPPPTENRGITA